MVLALEQRIIITQFIALEPWLDFSTVLMQKQSNAHECHVEQPWWVGELGSLKEPWHRQLCERWPGWTSAPWSRVPRWPAAAQQYVVMVVGFNMVKSSSSSKKAKRPDVLRLLILLNWLFSVWWSSDPNLDVGIDNSVLIIHRSILDCLLKPLGTNWKPSKSTPLCYKPVV